MRTIIFATFTLTLAMLGTTGAPAAPLSASAIANSIKSGSIVHEVPCRMRRYCNRRGCVTRRVCW